MMMRHLIVAIVAGLAAGAIGAVTPADMDKAIAAIRDYDTGKPRAALTEVERIAREVRADPAARAALERRFVQLLEGQASYEARSFVCEQLAQMGTDASVPALAKLLADEKTAHIAALALGANPSEAAASVLRRAAADAKANPLICIVSALGDRRDAQSAGTIGRLLSNDSAPVVEAAASALGRIATAEAADLLGRARKTADGTSKPAIDGAYLQCAIGLAERGQADRAAAICQELLDPRESMLLRRGALVAMIRVRGADAVPLILQAMAGQDRMMQATAIAQIRTLPGREITRRFAEQLPNIPEPLQVLLLEALEDRADPAAREAVAAAAASRNRDVRLAAIKALGRLGDASCVPLLARAAAAGDNASEQQTALLALRRLTGGPVDAAIIDAMRTARGQIKAAFITILSDRGAASAVDALLAEARSTDPPIQTAALRALAQLAEPDRLPAILDVLVTMQQDQARREAESAVVAVAKKHADEARRAEPVLRALADTQSAPAKGSLLRALRGIATAPAFAAVKSALNDRDPAVQDAAVRALADWPDATALDALLKTCQQTANPTHRIVTLRGCVRLLRLGEGDASPASVTAFSELMKLAERTEEKRLVLGALTALPHPAALKLAESCLADPQVAPEAAVALVNVADTIKAAYREEVAAAVKPLAANASSANVKTQAQQILAYIDKLGDFITAWQICGPYTQPGKTNADLFNIAFEPEKPTAAPRWRILPPGTDSARPTIMSVSALYPGDHRVAYARTYVWSPADQPARIELGVDDAARVSLNGRLVLANNTAGACVPGAQKADVTLKKGWNLVNLKLVQATGPWEFCLRVCDRNGGKLDGVRADCLGDQPQVTRLFDGKTLDGWDGPQGVFRIEDGAIVGGSLNAPVPRNEFLTTKKEYRDFELRLKFKLLGRGANAGIQIRSRRIPNNHEMIGYQADLGDGYWGCLYDESRRNRVLARADADQIRKVLKLEDWNDYVIRCQGKRIRLWINGQQTVDYTEPDDTIEQVGLIGLQIHGGGPSEAWYKDIEIVELGN